jgi:hypothetical protein
MWRSFGVGMSEANDLAKTEPEPPKAAKRKQICYATFVRTPLFNFYKIIKHFIYKSAVILIW